MDKLKNTKAILFDLDGTLVDLPINYPRMRKRLKELFFKYNVKSEFRPLIPSIEKCLLKLEKKKVSAKKIGEMRRLAYSIIDDEETDSVVLSNLIPGSKEVLVFAKKRKMKIVVFTRNGSRCVKAVFEKYKFPAPDLIASRDKVGKLKPDRKHVLYVLEKLNLEKDECMIVGDSFHDVQAGKKLGIPVLKVG